MSYLFGWDALAWSALFCIALCALWLLLNSARGSAKAKSFLGGEEDEYSTPAGGFYAGFKDALAPVFHALEAYQSGVVNDYIAYAIIFSALVAAAAIITGILWFS